MYETILNVSESLGNKRWVGNSLSEDRLAEFIMQNSDVSLLTAITLAIRGINPDEVDQYLDPKIKRSDFKKNMIISDVNSDDKILEAN